MEEYLKIISYIVTGLSIVVSLIITFLTSIKTKSSKQESAELEEEIDKQEATITNLEAINSSLTKMEEVIAYVPTAIETAEQSGINNGIAKKLYALSLIMLKCNELGVDYQSNCAELDEALEKLITFSKEVNYTEGE